jgi:lipopolysaccharide/colanic/teichoic acid biosynthesis glycosyltransferase
MTGSIYTHLGFPWLYLDQRYSNGRPFVCYKIRTMHTGMEAQQPSANFVSKDHRDSRVLPSRGWMRRIGFDELPQLYNVMRGEMAFFGPRPMNDRDWVKLSSKQRVARASRKAGCFGPYAMLRRNKNEGNLLTANDALIRLLVRKEKIGGWPLLWFRSYILVGTLWAILQGKVR